MNIGFIGMGKMAGALLSGWLSSGVCRKEQVCATDIGAPRLAQISLEYGIQTAVNTDDNAGVHWVLQQSDCVLLAIKPQQAAQLLAETKACFHARHLVVSIMGGVTLQTLEASLPNSRVVRVMPNTPAMVAAGVTGICGGTGASAQEVDWVRNLFAAVGQAVVLPEGQMDALTALSGCGPAYVYMMIEAMADAGVSLGLSREVAQTLAAGTMAGAGQMVLQTKAHPEQLKDEVCSPGGGTVAGVLALEKAGFRHAVQSAVLAAEAKMRHLGQ